MSPTLLYGAWLLFPAVFFLMALWSALEKATNKEAKRGIAPGDHFKQGFFVLFCVGISIAVDQFALAQLVAGFNSEWLPLPFFQIILLPIVLYLGATLVGPSKEPQSKIHKQGGKK